MWLNKCSFDETLKNIKINWSYFWMLVSVQININQEFLLSALKIVHCSGYLM